MGQILSSLDFPGVIISTGNEGEYLDRNQTNTYISKDAGVTWRLLVKGNHVYDVGDQGGILVLAPSGVPTNYVLFSWDMGRTLNKMVVSQHAFYATKITTDRNSKGVIAIVQGVQEGQGNLGILISLDFSNLMPRLCDVKNLTDFDIWTPVFEGNE